MRRVAATDLQGNPSTRSAPWRLGVERIGTHGDRDGIVAESSTRQRHRSLTLLRRVDRNASRADARLETERVFSFEPIDRFDSVSPRRLPNLYIDREEKKVKKRINRPSKVTELRRKTSRETPLPNMHPARKERRLPSSRGGRRSRVSEQRDESDRNAAIGLAGARCPVRPGAARRSNAETRLLF